MTLKPKRRSLHFVPAVKAKFYGKALGGEADSVVFDLDDSVAPSAKEEARQTLRDQFPKNYDGPKELSIRINHAKSPFHQDDIALMRELRPPCVILTKVESPSEVTDLVAALEGSFQTPLNLILFIETLVGVYNIADILASSPHITGATLGTEDLCSEMGLERGTLEDNPILNRIMVDLAMQCHLHDIPCLGPVFRGFKDEAQLKALEEECLYLKKLNVRGQFAIHPTQVPVMNRVFDITSEELQAARETLAMFGLMEEKEGTAVISRGHQMEDTPSVVRATKLLDYAQEHGFTT